MAGAFLGRVTAPGQAETGETNVNTICFKDYREHLEETGLSETDALLKTLEEGDKICTAEAGHAGEHEFADENEVELIWVGERKAEFPA